MASRNYKYYQHNDKDLKDQYGDCVVRALTKVMSKTWMQVFDDLISYAKKLQCMYDCIKDLEDDIAEILEDDSDKDNFFYGIIKNHEIMMFDEFGRGNNVEIISAGDLTAMLASVRMLSCEFIENGK